LATVKSGPIASGGTEDQPSGQGDDLDLVCGETIPGSPVHPSSASATGSTGASPVDATKTNNVMDKSNPVGNSRSSNGTASRDQGQASTRLEMPFASVPESVEAGPVSNAGSSNSASNMPATLPPASETPETTAASTPSRLSPIGALANAAMQALAGSNDDGSKSPGGGDSSEVDMDSLKAESVDIEGSSSGEAKQQRGVKRKAPSSEVGSRSPAPASRRKRRARESGHRGGRGGSRGRHSSGVRGHNNDDTDESEEAKDAALSVIDSLDNDALAALAQQSPKSTKFNFYPDFDSSMSSDTRIALIQQNIKNLKKAYTSIKSKLASTERQIKKIRRKEREKSEDNKSATAIEASA